MFVCDFKSQFIVLLESVMVMGEVVVVVRSVGATKLSAALFRSVMIDGESTDCVAACVDRGDIRARRLGLGGTKGRMCKLIGNEIAEDDKAEDVEDEDEATVGRTFENVDENDARDNDDTEEDDAEDRDDDENEELEETTLSFILATSMGDCLLRRLTRLKREPQRLGRT